MTTKKQKLYVVKCPDCQHVTSGPDLTSVEEAHARHLAKKHKEKAK